MKPLTQKLSLKTFSLMVFCLFISIECLAQKIGFVDMERVTNNSPQISKALDEINKEFEAQFETIKQKEYDLETLEVSITKDGAMMPLEKLSQLQERARILERQIRRLKEDLRDSMSIRQTQVFNDIEKEINKVVENYAITNNYQAILINEILYVNEEMDITDEILQLLKNTDNKSNEN